MSFRTHSDALTTLQQGSRELVAMVTAMSANLLLHERRTLVDWREVYGVYRYTHTHTIAHTIYSLYWIRQTRFNPWENSWVYTEMVERERKRIIPDIIDENEYNKAFSRLLCIRKYPLKTGYEYIVGSSFCYSSSLQEFPKGEYSVSRLKQLRFFVCISSIRQNMAVE